MKDIEKINNLEIILGNSFISGSEFGSVLDIDNSDIDIKESMKVLFNYFRGEFALNQNRFQSAKENFDYLNKEMINDPEFYTRMESQIITNNLYERGKDYYHFLSTVKEVGFKFKDSLLLEVEGVIKEAANRYNDFS
ncbi:MAG: hypothetical protein PF542_01310 [Nanoarchaeota archaeon]|jgi:hypothetical protein|nr:hypothetical protein [Nanoarchaeota archaeon]